MLTSLLLQRYANDLDSALPMPLLRTRPAVPAAVQRTGDTPTTTPLVAQHSVGALAAQPASLARQEEKAAAPAALPESGQGAYAAPATSSVIRSAVIVALAPALHARRMGTPALQRMEAGLQVQPSASQPAAPIDWGALPLVQRSMAGSALVAQLGATSLVARSPALVPSVLAARTASQPAAATAIPALALPPASPDSPNDAVAAYGASDNDWADGTDAGFAPGASDGGWPYGPDADNLGKPQPPIARTSDAPPLDLAPRSAAPATPSDAPALPQWGGSAAQVPQQDSFVPITRTMPELELAQPTQANPQRTPADAPPDAPATQSAQGAQGAQGANQINIEVLAQKVYDHLRRRLQIDHERRGRTGSERGVR